MSKRQKCIYEDRLQAVENYLSGKKNQKQIAADLGLGKRGCSTVGLWVRKYQEAEPESLKLSVWNRVYSKEFKKQVFQEFVKKHLNGTFYLNGIRSISARDNILREIVFNYDDQMEIYSPGDMFDSSIVQNLDTDHIASKRRNPVIANIFSRMQFMECRGSGFRKIKADYRHAVNYRSKGEPLFRSTPTLFFITLYNLNYNVPKRC